MLQNSTIVGILVILIILMIYKVQGRMDFFVLLAQLLVELGRSFLAVFKGLV